MTCSAADRRVVQRHEARQLEERFLAAVAANSDRLASIAPRPGARPLPANKLRRSLWPFDRTDEVKRAMADRGLYDRQVLDEMPADRASIVEFSRRRLFGRRKVVGLMGLVVNPIDALVADGRADRPATLAQAAERLHGLLPDDGTFHYVGAFSPTGWEPAALEDIPGSDDYELYLVEKGDGTEWLVHGRGNLRHLFNPESDAERRARCRAFIRARRGETMLGGISVEAVASGVRVERPVAEGALREAARHDDHLVIQHIDGAIRLVHTEQATPGHGQPEAPDQMGRSHTMGLWERLLQWLGIRKKAPDPQEMVRGLEQRRARLQVQRDELDLRIEDLEKSQREFGEQLKAEESPTRRVGLAQKIANVRRRVKQMHRRISLFDKAVGVLNTHIDNLTLASEAREFELPSEMEMKAIAVEVDGLVDEINERADLAMGLDTAAAADAMSPEVEAILEEFGVAEPKVKAPAKRKKAAAPEPETPTKEPDQEKPQPPKREKAPPATD